MIRQTHNLVLKDTSESEMARFRQFMLHVVRMQVEEGKAAAEWNQFIASEYGSAPENNQPKLSTSEVISKPKVSVPTKSQLKAKPKAAVKKQANLKPINQRGFVIAENGIRLHATPSPYDAQYKAKKGRYATIYKKMDFVTIVHEDLDNKGWYKIKTLDGQYGYIEKKHIALVPYDEVLDKYTRTFLLVKPNYTFEINIANRLYPNYKHKTGDDRRTLAEAFYLLNKQSKHRHGVVLKERDTSTIDKLDIAAKAFADPNFQKARALYDQLQLTSGYIVRIPTNEYINLQKKKGTLSQRSAIENFIIEMARAHQGFYEGFIYGLYSQIKDLVVGLWDLLKGILTGSLFKSIWDFVVKIWEGGLEGLKKFLNGITDAIGRNWNTFWKKFNSGNPRLQAYLIGELIAVVVFNIVLAIVTAGATVYLAATTKGAALLAKFPKIAKLVHKAIDAIPKSQRNLIQKVLKDKAGNVLYESNRRIVANELRREIDAFGRRQVRKKARKKIVKALKKLVILSRFQLIKLFKLKDEVLDLLKRFGIAIRADIDNLDLSRQLAISGGYFEVMYNGQQLFSATREELSKFFDNIKKINDNAGFAETKKMLQSIKKAANPKTVREVIENYAKKSGTSKKTSKLLKDVLAKGDEIAVNAAEVYTQNANIRNRVILNKGALEKVFNKPVVSAYIERFKKYDILDINGNKIDINPSNESQIKELFEGKYALYYNGKMREITFEAHHIVPKELLLDPDLRELHIFVKNNTNKFDFNGLDNGIPIHKYSKEFKELGGHGSHKKYNELTKEKILDIKEKSYRKGIYDQDLFEENLLQHINDTRQDITKQVIEESKKVNDLIFTK